jgi:hypothetical protein
MYASGGREVGYLEVEHGETGSLESGEFRDLEIPHAVERIELFPSALGKPWVCLFWCRPLKLRLRSTCISLTDALNKLAERHLRAVLRF